MRTETFSADSMAAALRLAKRAFGAEAYLLGTREQRHPDTGRLRFEVVAAGEPSSQASAVVTGPSGFTAAAGEHEREQEEQPLMARLDTLATAVAELSVTARTRTATGTQPGDPLVAQLVDAGVNPGVAASVVGRARARVAPTRGPSVAREPDLASEIGRSLVVAPPLWGGPGRIVAALLGPTGAGKTLTVVKLAGLAAFVHNRRVGIVTTDVHRIGEAQRLEGYAVAMDLPFERAADAAGLAGALTALAECDFVVVDTAGHGAHDERGRAAVASVTAIPGVARHLVLPVTARVEALRDAAARYRDLGPASLILTKTDEVASLGPFFDAVWSSALPVSHVGDGQGVPEDLRLPPAPAALASALLT